MKKVAVLMSTYNGEKYIREQITSILEQKGVQVTLFIRDDVSKDNTVNVIHDMQKQNSSIKLSAGKKNLNVGNSFMTLVYSVPDEYDYYALADQDDIWLPDKLSEAILMLEDSGFSLYASNQENVDKNGISMGLRYTDEKIHLTPESIISRNMLAGCTMVFSLKVKQILSEKDRRPSAALLRMRIHDVWIASVAAVMEGICYDERSFIQYRQHENNVVGSRKDTIWDDLHHKMDKLMDASQRNGRSLLALELTEKYSDFIAPDSFIRKMAQPQIYRKELLKRVGELCEYTGETSLALRMKMIAGLF